MNIYVETFIRAPLDEVWRLTQTPDLHARWDLRFTDIEYLPRPDESQGEAQPQRFLYATRIGFGLEIRGEGETVGSRETTSGGRTSVLKFWSEDAKSLIREGSGYWKYQPAEDGVRFWTQYDYETRFGALGRCFDTLIFKPLMGWATAWSFDCLRLWAERGIEPETLRERAAVHAMARWTLAFIWMYQGLVPKLLFPDSGELAIVRGSGLLSSFPGAEMSAIRLIGVGEIVFGLLLLLLWRSRAVLMLNIGLLAALTLGALLSGAAVFIAPFNPVTLNAAMVALAAIGLLSRHDLPSARNCRRHKPMTKSAMEPATTS